MPYRVVYGETMPAWEKIVPTTRAADRFKRQREHVGDVVFSIARSHRGRAAAVNIGCDRRGEQGPAPSLMGELPRPRMANERISSPSISPTATRHAFVIGCSAPVAIPASTFPPQGLSLQPLQTHSPPDVRDRSPQRPHALALAEGRPHPHARPRMRRRGARRAARGEERDQARGNRIATRQARPLTKASRVLERRSRQNRDRDRRAAEPEAPTRRAAYCLIGQ